MHKFRAPTVVPSALPALSRWQRMEKQLEEENPMGPAAPPFTDMELAAQFVVWGTPPDGQAYVHRARREPPSRKVQSRLGNVVTHYPSRKMRRRLHTESRKAEYRAVVRHDFDGFTREIYCQPPQVGIPVQQTRKVRDGSTETYTANQPYTPDVLLIMDTGLFVDEWKPERELERLAGKYPGFIFKDEDNTWRCPQREKFFADLGITFRMRSADENSATLVSNLEFLDDFFSEHGSALTDAAWMAINQITADQCPMTLARLLSHATPDKTPWNEMLTDAAPEGGYFVDDVYKAIAEQRLFVDLSFDDLSEPQDVIVCNSGLQLAGVCYNRPPTKATSDLYTFSIDIGTEFSFSDRPELYEVALKNEDSISYFDKASMEGYLMPASSFQQALERREISLMSSRASTDEILRVVDGVTDDQIWQAKRRFTILRQLKQGIRVLCDETDRTLQRWKASVRAAGESVTAQIRALMPKPRSGGRSQLPEAEHELIKQVVSEGNNPTNPLLSHGYKRYLELSKSPVSKNTYYRVARLYVDIKARKGSRAAYQEEPATWYLSVDDKIHGGRPFHRVHIDHTKVDVLTKIRGRGDKWFKRRAWMTVAMDAETRVVLAFYLALHAPSAVSVMMVIRAMVAKWKRTPATLVLDNGKEFHSYALERLCDVLNITVQFRPAHMSRFGSVMERIFGITNTELIHNLVGNTKALKYVRTVTKSVDPINAESMTFAELHGLLEYWYFQDYNLRKHPAHDHAPVEYMHLRFASTGRRLARITPYDERFYIMTCIPPSKRGSTRMLDKQRGIKIGHVWYWCDEFADRSVRPQKLEVLVDMWDVSICYVNLHGNWIRCVSSLLMRYRRLTAIEWRYIGYELRSRMAGLPDDSMETTLHSVLHDYPVHDDAMLTEATRQVYGNAGLVRDFNTNAPDGEAIIIPASPQVSDDAEADGEDGWDEDAEANEDSVLRNPLPMQNTRYPLNYDDVPPSGAL